MNLTDAVYNVPLDSITPKASDDVTTPLPWILTCIVDHLRNYGMKEEVIFAFPGDIREVEAIRNLADRVCDAQFLFRILLTISPQSCKAIDLRPYQIKSVADALCLWLELLPDPAIPYPICDSLLTSYGPYFPFVDIVLRNSSSDQGENCFTKNVARILSIIPQVQPFLLPLSSVHFEFSFSFF